MPTCAHRDNFHIFNGVRCTVRGTSWLNGPTVFWGKWPSDSQLSMDHPMDDCVGRLLDFRDRPDACEIPGRNGVLGNGLWTGRAAARAGRQRRFTPRLLRTRTG